MGALGAFGNFLALAPLGAAATTSRRVATYAPGQRRLRKSASISAHHPARRLGHLAPTLPGIPSAQGIPGRGDVLTPPPADSNDGRRQGAVGRGGGQQGRRGLRRPAAIPFARRRRSAGVGQLPASSPSDLAGGRRRGYLDAKLFSGL